MRSRRRPRPTSPRPSAEDPAEEGTLSPRESRQPSRRVWLALVALGAMGMLVVFVWSYVAWFDPEQNPFFDELVETGKLREDALVKALLTAAAYGYFYVILCLLSVYGWIEVAAVLRDRRRERKRGDD